MLFLSDIELSIMNDPPIQAVLGNKDLRRFINGVQNPWMKFQLRIWNMVRGEYKLHDKLRIIRWCAYDADFKPNQLDHRFKTWIAKGITTFYSLTENGQLKDFQTLRGQYALEKQDFYRYLQLRHYFDHTIKNETLDMNDPVLKVIVGAYQTESSKGIIARLCKGFIMKKSHSTEYIKNKWEKEGNFVISNEEWSVCCDFQWKCTNSHVWREFGWKCLARFFTTPKQKAHFTGEDSKCWRVCGSREANHWHVFWECPVIRYFWEEIHEALESIFNTEIPFQFCTLYLGKVDFHSEQSDKYLFGVLISASKKALTRRWLLPDSPTIEEWIDLVNGIYIMEKITFTLRLQMNKFIKLWSKWITFVQPLRPDFIEVTND